MIECPSTAWDRETRSWSDPTEVCLGCRVALTDGQLEAGAAVCSFACFWVELALVIEERRRNREADRAEHEFWRACDQSARGAERLGGW